MLLLPMLTGSTTLTLMKLSSWMRPGALRDMSPPDGFLMVAVQRREYFPTIRRAMVGLLWTSNTMSWDALTARAILITPAAIVPPSMPTVFGPPAALILWVALRDRK